VGYSGLAPWKRVGAVIDASVVGDCLKVGSVCDDTDPADKTDGARFQQMGGPALAQRMRRNPLADAGATCSFATCDPDGLVANRLIEPAAKSACGKQVELRLAPAPVLPQGFE